MNAFQYELRTKVFFGKGAALTSLPSELSRVGKRVMLAYGSGSLKRNGIYDEIRSILIEAGKEVVDFSGIMPNPTYTKVQEGALLAREKNIDFILAVGGGGSVIDCCKVISVQALLEKDIWDMKYIDKQHPTKEISMGVIVTAAGTGAEMNNGVVITYEEKQWKGALIGTQASFAILDCDYTKSLPIGQVISGAFDTLSHCMKTYLGSPREVNISDEINESVMRCTIENMKRLLENPYDMEARSELMWASSMAENGLLKIGKVTDFQAHQIEHQLGAYTDCNHGQGLAVIHLVLYRHIYKEGIQQFSRLAREVWKINDLGKTDEMIALAGIEALATFVEDMGLPTTLTEMGITDMEVLRKVAQTTSLTAGCCKKLDSDEIFEILKECLQIKIDKEKLMKKLLSLVMVLFVMIALTACQQESQPTLTNSNDSTQDTSTNTVTNETILIAYYSYSGTTKAIAEEIQHQTGGDLVEIQREESYPSDFYDIAENEIKNGDQPAIRISIDNIDKYETIFVGYPIWWEEAPAMIRTFVNQFDFTDKTVIPFCTSTSDPIKESVDVFDFIRNRATVLEGLRVTGKSDLESWLKEIQITK